MGHLLEIKMRRFRVKMHILSSTSVQFTLTTVQVRNLALTQTKRITDVQLATVVVHDRQMFMNGVLLIREELKVAADAAIIAVYDVGAALAASAANVTKCK